MILELCRRPYYREGVGAEAPLDPELVGQPLVMDPGRMGGGGDVQAVVDDVQQKSRYAS